MLTFAQTAAESDSNGKLIGTVFDSHLDAVIQGVEMIVEAKGIKRTVTTNETGASEFDLPSGIYSITVKQGWFYPLRRARFRAHPESISRVNIYPAIRLLSIGLELTVSGVREPATYAKSPKYDALSLLPVSSLDLLLEFKRWKPKGICVLPANF